MQIESSGRQLVGSCWGHIGWKKSPCWRQNHLFHNRWLRLTEQFLYRIVNNFAFWSGQAHWLKGRVRFRLRFVPHTRKCPKCGSPASGTRTVCPRCAGAMTQPRNWDDQEQSRSTREGKRHAANTRMRNSGAGLFII